jgi:hypothetical protein
MNSYQKASAAITMFLGLIITIIIIVSIIKFSKFRLTSLDYQRRTILVVILGVVSIAFIFSSLDIFGGIFVALQVFFSIWLMVYAILVRRKVLTGTVQEMKRPCKEGNVNVELEGGTGNAPAGSPPQNPMGSGATQSFRRSLATDGEEGAVPKKAREFV